MSGYVARRLGAQLRGDAEAEQLVSLGLRRNPRRAHLLVSTVLGKHVPADPGIVIGTGARLGDAVAARIAGHTALVIGFAETATGLGHGVADRLAASYLHSTRRAVPGYAATLEFEEPHSHAVAHRLLPADPLLLRHGDVAVLVDDELSTGTTAANLINALHSVSPRDRYVVAALIDARPAGADALTAVCTRLGVPVDVVSLARAEVSLPAGFAAAAAEIGSALPAAPAGGPGTVRRAPRGWPAGVRADARHGWTPDDTAAARHAAATVAAELDTYCGDHVLVLGTEELMYAPTLIAQALAIPRRTVRVSSTTRSPVTVIDDDGYPVRHVVAAGAHDGAAGTRFAYNIASGRYDDIVLVVDEAADTSALHNGPTALVPALAALTARVHVITLPTVAPPPVLRGPAFGSYRPDEVGWLLADVSDADLEAPTEEREEAIQTGGAHYAESLPREYRPDAAYRALFENALDTSAARVAHAAGLVGEIVLAERAPRPVLVSLARAGTPVGILLRRWAAWRHGLDLPHYAISIVRGRGIDVAALARIAALHDAAHVVFVDGWTGKGAITRELATAVADANRTLHTAFDPRLAVLADPGECVDTFGTRDDFLVPSACLNATVSGLVSRTVLNPALLRRGGFHGAKHYRELAADDVSARFLDAVSARFADVADRVAADLPAALAADRRPTWRGRADVDAIADRYAIGDTTLVKPGVGETTRVLLRRVPWRVLLRPDAGDDVAHLRALAAARGVPVEICDGLRFQAVGLIHPRFTRAATGADGLAVASPA